MRRQYATFHKVEKHAMIQDKIQNKRAPAATAALQMPYKRREFMKKIIITVICDTITISLSLEYYLSSM